MPYAAAAQIHQLPLAGIDDDPLRVTHSGVSRRTEGLLMIGHVGSLDSEASPSQSFPEEVHANTESERERSR